MIKHTQKSSELVKEIMRIARGPGVKKRIKDFEALPVISEPNDGVRMDPNWQDDICDRTIGPQSNDESIR